MIFFSFSTPAGELKQVRYFMPLWRHNMSAAFATETETRPPKNVSEFLCMSCLLQSDVCAKISSFYLSL